MAPRCLSATLLAASWAGVGGWVTFTQARMGATVDALKNESYGDVPYGYPVQQTLGFLWNKPHHVDPDTDVARLDMSGLGGSITWAWDPRLCDRILRVMEEDFWEMSFINCRDVQASLHRAFDTWAMNHREIKFTDVTKECERRGMLYDGGCSLAEIWVTFSNASTPLYSGVASGSAVDTGAAVSVAYVTYTSDFLYTNGRNPRVVHGPYQSSRRVVETVGGRLSFNTDDPFCWYLDSSFCQGWHDLKNSPGNTPEGVYACAVTLLFFFWGVAMVVATMHYMFVLRNIIRKHHKYLLDEDQQPENRIAWALLLSAEELGTYRMVSRLMLVMLPWAFYKAIFLTCWDCYDFEAVAAHEIGHLLGLGQPDLVPTEVLADQGPGGQNSYHALLALGHQMNLSTCLNPWEHVFAGIPPALNVEGHADINPRTGNRWAVMDSLDKHNPRTCLTADDLEGLNVIYPVCSGGMTVPLCTKQSLIFLGWLRVCVFLIGPFILAVATTWSVLLPYYGWQWNKRRKALQASSAGRARVEQTASTTTGVVEIVQPPPAPEEPTTPLALPAPPPVVDQA